MHGNVVAAHGRTHCISNKLLQCTYHAHTHAIRVDATAVVAKAVRARGHVGDLLALARVAVALVAHEVALALARRMSCIE